MGFVGFLNLLVTSFDVLVWPVITIVYPLYASIQAIQTNSHFENRRWLTYWVLCGLIMIFELICARFIGWFPFWPQVKLMTTCWLAIPHFNGAGYAYNHFVRPCFSVNLQTVKSLVRTGQEEFHISEPDNFLLVAERYIQEKGSEALEKLIFDKVKCKEPNYTKEENTSKDDMKSEEAEPFDKVKCKEPNYTKEENTSKDDMKSEEAETFDKVICKEPNYSKEENTFKDDMKSEEAETFDKVDLIVGLVPIPIHNDCKSVAFAEKELLLGSEVEDGSTAYCGSSVLVNAQKEWTCALCQVCTTSELVLQKHLQGSKHKANEKEIEKTMAGKNRFPSTSNSKRTERLKPTSHPNSRKTSESKCRVTQKAGLLGPAPKDKHVQEFGENKVGVAGTRDQSIQKSSQSNTHSVTKPSNLWCDKCKVKCSSSTSLVEHLRGRKHIACLQEAAVDGIVQANRQGV